MTPGEIWDVLVERCQASSLGKGEFESYFLSNILDRGIEYRFQGALGFGGKVWLKSKPGAVPYVTCYPEDLTDEREIMIRAANGALRKMSGIREVDGAALEVLASKRLTVPAGQLTKCRLDGVVFYIRENFVDVDGGKKQVLELACPDFYRKRIESVVGVEDSLGRAVVLNPEFTAIWAEDAFLSADAPPPAKG